MQLSAPASSASDISSIAASALPGVPASTPDGTTPSASSFAELLPEQPGVPADTGKKCPNAADAAAGEGAALMMMSWLAALTPSTPVPTETPTLDGIGAATGATLTDGTAAVSAATDATATTTAAVAGMGVGAKGADFVPGQAIKSFAAMATSAQRTLRAQKHADACDASVKPVSTDEPTAPTTDLSVGATAATTSEAANVVTATTDVAMVQGAEVTNIVPTEPAARPIPHGAIRAAKAAFKAEMTSENRWEKIAAPDEQKLPAEFPTLEDVEKKILNIEMKQVTKEDGNLGIGTAISRPTMFTSLFNHPQSTSVGATSAVADASANPSSVTTTAEQASQAHRAMNVILTVADRLSSSNRSSVQLNFSVGGADLSVRVEMRAGEVHATFRTDSTELRSALAAEWQSVSADASRAARLADAVFAPASAAGATPYNGEGASQQRESNQRQAAEVIPFPGIHGSVLRSSAEAPAPEFRQPAFRPDLNLYTFA